MAGAFSNPEFIGLDYHNLWIGHACAAAIKAGVGDHAGFEVATAKGYSGTDYDSVAFFDCLHDVGDPVGASPHVTRNLRSDGTWMIVEPFAHDRAEEGLSPVGRVYWGASTLICTPASEAPEVRLVLGAQAGEARIRQVIAGGGFTRFRRAAEAAFSLVFGAGPWPQRAPAALAEARSGQRGSPLRRREGQRLRHCLCLGCPGVVRRASCVALVSHLTFSREVSP